MPGSTLLGAEGAAGSWDAFGVGLVPDGRREALVRRPALTGSGPSPGFVVVLVVAVGTGSPKPGGKLATDGTDTDGGRCDARRPLPEGAHALRCGWASPRAATP